MAGTGDRLLYDINCMYANNLACIRVKGSESELFRIVSGVKEGCCVTVVFNVSMGREEKEVKFGTSSKLKDNVRVMIGRTLKYAKEGG